MVDQAPTEVWTVQRVLRWATDDFRSRGLESPRLDAELLLCRTLGIDRIKLIVESKRPLAPPELERFKALFRRRRKAEPMAYVLGEREFYGLSFRVDARVLVPRPDTEILVETALRRTRSRDQFGAAVDVCTGSGCVAVAFSKQRPTWRVCASDVSAGALQVASLNAQRLGTVFGFSFFKSDLFNQLPEGQRYSLITANPPYIPRGEIPDLQQDVRDYEPHVALDGGDDGLDLVRRIISEARPLLAPGGVLAMEIGHDQADRVHRLMQSAGYSEIERDRDYGGFERVISGILSVNGSANASAAA
jgi:release factor glutamine methyltransferase